MTICVIEALTTGTDVWSPIVVGNRSNARGGVRFQALEQKTVKGKKEELTKSHFRVLNFNKDGGVSTASAEVELLRYYSTAPIFHKMAKAYDAEREASSWRSQYFDRFSFRVVPFNSITAFNEYLKSHDITPVVQPAVDEATEVVLNVDGTKTAAELYQELGRLIATDVKAADRAIVSQPTVTEVVLTDKEIVEQQTNIMKASTKNVLAILQRILAKQAKDHITRVFSELGPNFKVPEVEVTVIKTR